MTATIVRAVATAAGLVIMTVAGVASPLVELILIASWLAVIWGGFRVVRGLFVYDVVIIHGPVCVATVLKHKEKTSGYLVVAMVEI